MSNLESPTNGGRSEPFGWGGVGAEEEVLSHQWQKDWSDDPEMSYRQGQRSRRIRLGILLSLFLSLMVLFVYFLLFSPPKTPVITVMATDYAAPMPPIAWSREDLRGISELDGRTLRLVDATISWRTKRRALASLERELTALRGRGSSHRPVVLYLSVHGMVDESGTPCLVLSGSSPLRSSTWLPVREVLGSLGELTADETFKLVVLDCNRQQVNWNAGLIENTFTERLEETVENLNIPNLAVLNASGVHQKAWTSAELQRSIFSHFLQTGLAGEADMPLEEGGGKAGAGKAENGSSSNGDNGNGAGSLKGGNDDGQVSIGELVEYLHRTMSPWVKLNRGEQQEPLLLPVNAKRDAVVSLRMNRRDLRRMVEARAAFEPPAPVVSEPQLEEMWTKLDLLRPVHPERFTPFVWRDLEQKALRVEQLADAGAAYVTDALRLRSELIAQFDLMLGNLPKTTKRGSLADLEKILNQPSASPPNDSLHSLALQQYFGGVDSARVRELRIAASRFAGSLSSEDLTKAVEAFGSESLAGRTDEEHFLRTIRGYQSNLLWRRAEVWKEGFELLHQADRLSSPFDFNQLLPGDERAHYWIRPTLINGDEKRRTGQDLLFVSEAAGADGAMASFESAAKVYDHAEAQMKQATDAFAMRDAFWSQAAYLAQWLSSPLPGDARSEPIDEEINGKLLPLLRAAHELGERLDEHETAVGTTLQPLPFDEDFERFKANVEKLRGGFDGQIATLKADDEEADPALSWWSIDSALRTPLISAGDRRQLRDRRTALEDQLNTAYLESLVVEDGPPNPLIERRGKKEKTSGGEAADEYLAPLYLERVLGWERHPALSILRIVETRESEPSDDQTPPDEPEEADEQPARDVKALEWSRIENWGRSIRRRLDALSRAEVPREAGETAVEQSEAKTWRHRRQMSDLDRRLRAAAPFGLAAPAESPVQLLRQMDVQHLLLYHQRRALDDFWGIVRNDEQLGGRQPFFDTVASDLLRSARAIVEKPDTYTELKIAELETLHLRRRSAATSGLLTTVEDVLIREAAANAEVDVRISQRRQSAQSENGRLGLPVGVINLRLYGEEGERLGEVEPLRLPFDGPEAKRTFLAPADGKGAALTMVAAFRGHEFSDRFQLRDVGGRRVRFRPHRYDSTQVTLLGNRRKRVSVVFVLDCSASMEEMVNVEAVGGNQLSKLELAKSAMGEMLDELATSGEARVGVRLYGHRVGWTQTRPVQLARQTDLSEDIPEELLPSRDVEEILPLGRFSPSEAEYVKGRVRGLTGFGQSPLYYSLVEAAGDFARDDQDTAKSIVVITDGANYQFTPSGAGALAPARTSLQNVTNALEGQDIKVYIVGFGAAEEEQAAAERDFRRIANQTGGDTATVYNGRDLLTELRSNLGLGFYQVGGEAGQRLGVDADGQPTVRLNEPISIRPSPQVKTSYELLFESITRPFQLEGGEDLVVRVSDDGGDVLAPPYDGGFPRSAQLVSGESNQTYTVRAHRALRKGNEVVFPISVQSNRDIYTLRPAECWIEITPRLPAAGPQPESYTFYDVNFEPQKPVPVLHWGCQDWPAEATRASVRYWCKFEKTKPLKSVALSDVANDPGAFGAWQDFVESPGIRYRLRLIQANEATGQYKVVIEEEHSDEVRRIDSLRVQLETPAGVRPIQVRRRFDAENQMVTHTFLFDQQDARLLETANASRIVICSRDDCLANAYSLANDQPITINVVDDQDHLPIDAAHSSR